MGSQTNQITNTKITNFYKNKSILITGAAGFLGTALLEKLLFSCPDVKNIYVLMKAKKGKSAKERLKLHLQTEVAFQRLRDGNPEVLEKVLPVDGDLVEENLGLSEEDMETLRVNVSVVFHLAANISFDLPLIDTLKVNTMGTREILRICRSFINLEAFVYVSTAYCNCRQNNDMFEEKVVQTKTSVESALYIAECKSGDSKVVEKLLDNRPNMYTYSKALAEQLIESEYGDLPIAIVRPSVITGASKEPSPGWLCGFSGTNNIIFLQGMGVLRVWNGDADAILDIIPVDIVAQLLIAVVWDVAAERVKNKNEVKVFNCCSGTQNPVQLDRFMYTALKYSKTCYKDELLLPLSLLIIKSTIWHAIMFFLLHTIPAYIVHCINVVLGRNSRTLKLLSKLKQLVKHYNFFAINQFIFVDQNVKNLYLKMDEEDQVLFDFDISHINWDDYIDIYAYGLKEHLLKRYKNIRS